MIETFYRRCLVILALLLCSVAAFAQTCALPGWNGPVTIAAGTTYVNSYHGGSGNPAAGATGITVASATGQRNNTRQLLAGDMILIIQMQDSVNGANAGLHEYAQIASITGTAITLTKPLVNSYNQLMNTTNVRNWQVVWVPQYSALTVTGTASANTWTIVAGTGVATGGVLALDVAGSMALNGTLTASGMGFRGAFGLSGSGTVTAALPTSANLVYNTNNVTNQTVGGQKGEGIMGTPPRVFAGTVAAVTYTALLGQGYALGAGGQAAIGNAGGGANDGNPSATSSSNSYNAGGGGGGNYGAGGQGGNSWNGGTGADAALNQGTNNNIGNIAGGKGGNAQSAAATRLVMGGGGGAGAANNATVANGITAWPPTNTIATGNGATGPISSSGSSGGGIVLVRAGSVTGAGRVDVSGYRAYNKFPLNDTDSAGGGGAGGSVFFATTSGTGAGITINASGGNGGYSNYFQHGPGGGGGGGYILSNLTAASTNVGGGPNGTDACCGVTGAGTGTSVGSPKAWNAEAGDNGLVDTSVGTPSGLGGGGGTCLPNIAVTKSTSTPNITATTGAQARYSINLTNSGGGASNVFVFDASLPRNWSYTSAVATAYQYDPAPGGAVAANAAAAGAESVQATAPGAFPVTTVTRVNSQTAVTLRAAATAPGSAPTTGANTLTFGSFYLPSEGSLTISFTVNINNTSTVGTYHNPAGIIFLDPTRTLNTDERMVSPATNVNANRGGISYSSQTTYQSGGTANVGGSNYSGLQGGPDTEDVTLQPDLSVVKTKSTNTFTLGVSGLGYVMAVRNLGRTITHQIYANTQATSQSATAIIGSPALSDTMPTGISITSVTDNDANWTCTINATSSTFTCSVADADFPWNTNSTLVTITATVSVSFPACPGPQINTANVTTTTLGDGVTANNAGTVTTPIGCSTNLTVTKTNAFTTVMAGGTTAYTITVANLGPATGDGSTILDDPSDGLACTVTSCTPAGAGVCPGAGLLPNLIDTGITLSSFAPGSTLTFALSCTVTATGSN
ncbi:MAG: hypothetical protein V4542_10195 [Pseudomonadota bacterium]